jgi:hypothetical protein
MVRVITAVLIDRISSSTGKFWEVFNATISHILLRSVQNDVEH